MSYHFLSIDSVKLKIKDKAKGPQQIYGEIKLRAYAGHCYYIYHRHGHEAEPVPEDDEDEDSFPLTLCGPKVCRDPHDAGHIKVLLYENGPKPFFSTEFGLTLVPETRGPMCLPLDLPDDMGTLYVRYTWVICSLPARFQFSVIEDGETLAADLSIWGKITAKLIAGILPPNLITIFKTRTGPVIVPSGEPIMLPRSTFIVHVRSHSRGKGHYHPEEFLEIDVDLQAVRQDAGGELWSIKGKCMVFLYADDKVGQPR